MFVENLNDIEHNLSTFYEAIHLNSSDRQKFIDWVKAGKVFYPYQYGKVLAFAPSRFVGYKENSRQKHESLVADKIADGKETNPAISRIIGLKPDQNEGLERAFLDYCSSLGVTPHENKRSYWVINSFINALNSPKSAIDDIDNGDVGNDSPEYKRRMDGQYIRDPKVRQKVLRRAKGLCEFCSSKAFDKTDGQPYLETHHVISLSEQGKDKPSNVIALCPNHHREAHFGANWDSLQGEFLRILEKLS